MARRIAQRLDCICLLRSINVTCSLYRNKVKKTALISTCSVSKPKRIYLQALRTNYSFPILSDMKNTKRRNQTCVSYTVNWGMRRCFKGIIQETSFAYGTLPRNTQSVLSWCTISKVMTDTLFKSICVKQCCSGSDYA